MLDGILIIGDDGTAGHGHGSVILHSMVGVVIHILDGAACNVQGAAFIIYNALNRAPGDVHRTGLICDNATDAAAADIQGHICTGHIFKLLFQCTAVKIHRTAVFDFAVEVATGSAVADIYSSSCGNVDFVLSRITGIVARRNAIQAEVYSATRCDCLIEELDFKIICQVIVARCCNLGELGNGCPSHNCHGRGQLFPYILRWLNCSSYQRHSCQWM